MAHFDTAAAQLRWDSLIKRQGARGALRQPAQTDRPISVSVQRASPEERMGAVSNPLDKVAMVSALDPDTGLPLDPSPSERDVLVDGAGKTYKIVAPPDDMGPDVLPLYWELKVRS